MSPEFTSPNYIRLAGSGVELTYALDRAGKHLTYKRPQGEVTFGDADIKDLESPLGRLLTVHLEATPDRDTVDLTLVLPTINLPRSAATGPGRAGGAARPTPVKFSTFAVLTTTRTSIGGPGLVSGALQSYRVLELQGEATEVPV